MRVRELINKLTNFPMDCEVKICLMKKAKNEHGEVSGFCYDINNITQFGTLYLEFTDERISVNGYEDVKEE